MLRLEVMVHLLTSFECISARSYIWVYMYITSAHGHELSSGHVHAHIILTPWMHIQRLLISTT